MPTELEALFDHRGIQPVVSHTLMVPTSCRVLRFNMDGASRVKLSPAGAGGVLCNGKGDFLIIFSKPIDVCDSIEAEVLAILEALRLYSRYCNEVLIVESDSSNVISWVSNRNVPLWKFQIFFNESERYLLLSLMLFYAMRLDLLTLSHII
ncbi:hypothetical protein AAC387_Pa06g2478 [Persea americana]